jgi:hypothetical protein
VDELPVSIPEAPAPNPAVKLAAWKAARRDYSAAQTRMWQTSLLLGPLSFVGLGMLAGAQCPLPMDYLSLGGASTAMILLWTYIGERCQAQRERAGEELRTAEAALGQRPVPLESGSADRRVRLMLTVLFVILWGWTYTLRPDCSVDPGEESALTAGNGRPRSTSGFR